PRRDLVFRLVPPASQGRQVPPEHGCALLAVHAVGAFGLPLIDVGLHRGQSPVEREPRRPGVPLQVPGLHRSRVQSESVCLHHDRGTHRGSVAVATATAFAARRAGERCPYRRAHTEVSTSVTSRTTSLVVSCDCNTTMRRPPAAIDACRCSNPNRVSRSRCSTTMTVTAGGHTRVVRLS